MNYRFLGRSGLQVSEICFGAMGFTGKKGWTTIAKTDQKDADRQTAIAIDNGVNFFDTADIYSEGVSESMLGKALQGKRRDVLVATKCGFRMKDGPNGTGLSRKNIIDACEASLKRLKTDYIDLYQIHSYDFMTPLVETLSTFDRLIKQGKVRYFGLSNFTGWQIMKAIHLCEINGWEKPVSLQAYYSLLGRDLELELLPVCLDQGLGILPWSPLHGGILTGKYRNKKKWPKGTRLKNPDDHLPYDVKQGEKILQELQDLAAKKKKSMAQIALNYLLCKNGVDSVVTGARTDKQLLDNITVSGWSLEKNEITTLDALSEPPSIYPFWYFDIFRKGKRRYL